MSFANHHIDKVTSSNSGILVGLFSVLGFAAFLTTFSRRTKHYLLGHLIDKMSETDKDLESVLRFVKSKEYSSEKADKLYNKSKSLRKYYGWYYKRLEQSAFLNNETLKTVSNSLLRHIYSLEANFRMLSMANTPAIPGGESLIDFTSELPLGSAQA